MENNMKNAMLAQVESLPELIRSELDPIDQRVRELLSDDKLRASRNVFLTGCGDSYFAGVAAEYAFAGLAGVSVQAIPAMKAARFISFDSSVGFSDPALVLAISVSGFVARTVEAVKIARAAGANTVGITADPAAPLAGAAEKILDCRIPAFVDAPGVRTFRISLMTLYLIAIRMGEINEKISPDEGTQLRLKLKRTADAIEQSLESLEKQTKDLAHKLAEADNFTFVGHGPNLGTALFSAAKVIEAAGRNACGQDTEEWAHLQYFIHSDKNTPTFLLSPADQGRERLLELLEPMRRTGRFVVAAAPEEETGLSGRVDWHLPIRGKVAPLFSPMVYSMAGELFAAQLAEALGVSYFGQDQDAYRSGNNTIRSSRVMSAEEVKAFWASQAEERLIPSNRIDPPNA